MSENKVTKFYEKQWFMWVCLIIFPPAGIILVWINKGIDQKKKIIYSVIGAVWLAIVLIFGGGNKSKEPSNSTVETAPTSEVTVSPTPEASAVTESNENDKTTDDSSLSDDELISMIKTALSENFENYDVTFDKESKVMTINLWSDGITLGLASYETNEDVKESWDTMVDSITTMSASAKNTCDSVNRSDVNINVNVLNDLNKDNVLLSTLNGTVYYNVVTE